MMFALYVVLGWSLVGSIAAILMGRAMAACGGEQQDTVLTMTDQQPVRAQTTKSFSAAKAA